jgi:hypothetical protein
VTATAMGGLGQSSRKSAQANLFIGLIKELTLLVPPIAQQRVIQNLVAMHRQHARDNAQSVAELSSLAHTLSHDAFSGRL